MNRKILLMLLLSIFCSASLYAQPPACNNPPNCVINWNIVPPGTDGVPIGTSVNQWAVSAGTPKYGRGIVGPGHSGLRFERVNNVDAAAYTCYNFQQGKRYAFCAKANMNNGSSAGGKLIVEAWDGGTAFQTIYSQFFNQPFTNWQNWQTLSTITLMTGTYNRMRVRIEYNGVSNYSVDIDDMGIVELPTINATATSIAPCQSTTLNLPSNMYKNVTWSPSTGLNTTSGNTVVAQPCSTITYTATFNSNCYGNSLPVMGCTNSVQITITVTNNGSIVNNNPVIPCNGPINLSFSGIVCNNSTYEWYGPQNNLITTAASLNMASSNPSDEGTYTLKIKSQNGCEVFYTTAVIMTGCCSVKADFTTQDCNSIRFINASSGNGASGEFFWDFGDGTYSTTENPAHFYQPNLGLTTVCLTAVYTNGFSTCCDKVCKDVMVCDHTTCFSAFDHEIVDPVNGLVQFLDKSTAQGTATSWIWKVNGIPQSASQNPTLTLNPGANNVCLEVTFTYGWTTCVDEWCETINIP